MVVPPLKYTCTPCLLQNFLGSHSALCSMELLCMGFWLLLVLEFVLLLLSLFWPGFLVLIFILLRAHAGYLHFVSALYRLYFSCCSSCGFEQMVWTLWCWVPITLYLDGIVWWLSHCKYMSVWVGFLYTVVLRLPSSFGIISISKKGMDPSSLWSSLVNCMCSAMELMCSKNSLLCDDLILVKVSSTYLS